MAIKLSNQVLMAAVESEAILLQTDAERYFGLNSTALRMLEVLTEEPTIGAAREKLLVEFDADTETMDRDIQALLDQLRARNLIEEAGA